jgi:hypothetical protein
MSRVADADRNLFRWSRRLVLVGLIAFVVGLPLGWWWLTAMGALVLLLGATINLVRFLPIRPFWK